MQENFEPIDFEPKASNNRRIAVAVIVVLLVIILAVTAALLVKYYVITTFIVDGISMYPTLDGGDGPNKEDNSQASRVNGETLYLNKLAKIKRGDIIVFTPVSWGITDDNGNPSSLVKRVIGVAGDRVQIIDNIVYLNGEILNEPYINEPMRDNEDLDITVTDGMVFCMGDNRNHSSDSRMFGLASLDDVVGKCFMIKSIGGKLRWI